jgi:hypothetical protein
LRPQLHLRPSFSQTISSSNLLAGILPTLHFKRDFAKYYWVNSGHSPYSVERTQWIPGKVAGTKEMIYGRTYSGDPADIFVRDIDDRRTRYVELLTIRELIASV